MAQLSQPVADTSGTQPFVYPERVLQTDINGNGISWHADDYALLSSTAYTTNTACADQTNYNWRGIMLFITTGTFGAGASTITVSIQGKDLVSGNYYTLATTSSLSASSTALFTLYPGASGTGTASLPLPKTWRVSVQASAWGTGGSNVGVAACVLI